MTDTHLVPANKFDFAAVERAKAAGQAALIPHYPALLEWLQDANWPVAEPVAQMLTGAGPEIVPSILDILRTDDDFWQQWVLDLIVRHLSDACWSGLKPDVDRLVYDGTTSDVRDLARELRTDRL